MEHIFSRDVKQTRAECEAKGTYYCDKSTPYKPPPHAEIVYHADVDDSTDASGNTVWKCSHCLSGRRTIPRIAE